MKCGGFCSALRQFSRGRHNATLRLTNHKVLPPFNTIVPGRIVLNQMPHNQFFNRPFSVTKKVPSGRAKRKYVPRKAAVKLTDRARTYFKSLLDNNPDKAGIMLHYTQASSGQPRMVFSFGFVTDDDLKSDDEGVSLEVDNNGEPLAPGDALEDGKPKLYVSSGSFLKVLGATVDCDLESVTPILYDREGNLMDPNA